MRFCWLAILLGVFQATALARAPGGTVDPRTSVPDHVLHDIACVAGNAGGFPCSNVDLQDRLPLSSFNMPGLPNPTSAAMLWGYTDTQTGKEYALLGLDNSLAIVELGAAEGGHATFVGRLPTSSGSAIWRDVRTFREHAFIGADSNGGHGMQVFDLRQLRNLGALPVVFNETAHYDAVRNIHTLWINEETGYAYLAGTNTCSGGLHMVDIRNPRTPIFAGCFSADGYTHEAECVVYRGPDVQHFGKEICLANDQDALVVVDVSNKSAPLILSSRTYPNVGYVHQSAFTEDFRYVLTNDELDEQNSGTSTRTYVFDMSDLDAPVLKGFHNHGMPAIDHNLYVRGNFVYESNYRAGLRILALTDLSQARLTEVGFFDIFPADNNRGFSGNWGNYPFFASNRVILSGIGEGLFVVKPRICAAPTAVLGLSASAAGANRIDLTWNAVPSARYQVERALGGCGADAGAFREIGLPTTVPAFSDSAASGAVNYGYRVRALDSAGACSVSSVSACVVASTSGACTAPPSFAGIASVSSANQASCAVDLSWLTATSNCGGALRYDIFRSADALFAANAGNRVASASMLGTRISAPDSNLLHYIVRSVDVSNQQSDSNTFLLSARATGAISNGLFRTGAELGDPPLNEASPVEGAQRTSVLSPEFADPEHVGWHITETQRFQGLRSYHSQSGSNYCISLETPTLQLSSGQSSVLSFWTRHGIAAGRDGGIVELRIDGGPWTALGMNETLPASLSTAGNACGIPVGRPAFAGIQNIWTRFSANLAAYAGRSVQVRFLYTTGSNASASNTGWFLDELEVSNAQVPGPCSAGGEFANGFE